MYNFSILMLMIFSTFAMTDMYHEHFHPLRCSSKNLLSCGPIEMSTLFYQKNATIKRQRKKEQTSM